MPILRFATAPRFTAGGGSVRIVDQWLVQKSPRQLPAEGLCCSDNSDLEVALSAEEHAYRVLILQLIHSCRLGNRPIAGAAIAPEYFWSRWV